MRKLALLFLLCATPVLAQRTIVSGTVTDINGVPYAGGTMVATLTLPVGASGAILNGAQITGATQRVTLDGTGSFLMQLADNNVVQCTNSVGQIITCVPSTKWNFAINISPGAPPPLGTGPQNCSVTLTITGVSQSISSSLGGCPALGKSFSPQGLLPTQLIQNGILADYRMLPTENPCFLVDYSNNGNNATGCNGTPPTIVANTGGVAFNALGSINLPSALNPAQTVQVVMYNNNSNGGIIAGNGTPANSSILLATVFTQSNTQNTGDSALQHNSRILAGNLGGGSNSYVYPRVVISGTNIITWDAICDGAHIGNDTILINTVDMASYNTPTLNGYVAQQCSQGRQTVGNYQFGGISTCTNYFGCGLLNGGTIYWMVFYNRPLSIQEAQQNVGFMQSVLSYTRGVNLSPFKNNLATPNNQNFTVQSFYNLAVDGDSLSCGPCAGATPNPVSPYSSYLFTGLLTTSAAGSWNISNMARVGFRLDAQMLPFAPVAIDPIYEPMTLGNVVVIWGGTNDTPGANTLAELSAYCHARQLVGWKVLPVTMISRTGLDAAKNAYNLAIRQQWQTFSDGFIDLAADPNIGADGANASAVYFANDHVHVQDVGIINDETPWIQRAVNRIFGNRDFSSATVYTSPAAAATATTAGTASGNTVTITFGATPANCQQNNMITLAGITPAGYNGNWLIRSRTATQITAFVATSGLGNITVQGTGVCPQQQDNDVYTIVNFGAGNFTLESCQGLTGQSIYIKNINAAASTIVPFQASETIDGAANLAIASNQTRILQAQLISASAAGCTWKVVQ